MMLPQQLESALLSDENADEAGQLVADWIDKVRARPLDPLPNGPLL